MSMEMQLLLAVMIFVAFVAADPPDQCYVTQAGCKYKVILQPIDCIANDEPRSPQSKESNVVHKHPLNIPEDMPAAVKRMETLEESLIRMMDGLSTRSLRHIRQIKTDLHQMSKTIEELKASSDEAAVERRTLNEGSGGRGKSSNSVRQCPAEFIGGGTWPACYRLAPFNASWHEAKDYCTAIGANLVSLETIKEAYIVDYLIKSNTAYQDPKGWWTSGNYIVRSYKWMWTSRHHLKPITYSRWAPGEPNARSTMHCLLLYRPDKYYWHDGTCTDKHAFICEIEL